MKYYLHKTLDTTDLTASEFIILSTLIKYPRQIFSTEQIIALIDEDSVVLPKSVNKRMQRLRSKLLLIDPQADIIISSIGEGYKLFK